MKDKGTKAARPFARLRKLVVVGALAGLAMLPAAGCSSSPAYHRVNDGSGVGQRECGTNPWMVDWHYTHGGSARCRPR
jgi:hypothetical protein